MTLVGGMIACGLWSWTATGRADDEGFEPLFDGKTLSGWVARQTKSGGSEDWSVVDGVLTAKAGSGWLSTDREYGDYVLRLEWRLPENGNSGIFLRIPDLKEGQQPWVEGMEVQVLDDRGPEYAGKLKPWQYSGSVYGFAPAKPGAFKGAGEWNAFEITCRGDRVSVVMNGMPVAEVDMAKHEALKNRPRKGFIGLQNHGSAVEYRNIRLKPLTP